MRINSRDTTLKKNHIQKYQYLINEYQQVKAKEHLHYRYVKDFYAAHGTCAQTFLKYYAHYQQGQDPESLLPGKRGPKWRTGCEIEAQVLKARETGNNRYDIHLNLEAKIR